jgi:hypothetical protein
MTKKHIGQIHRFRDKVALYLGTGETVYLETATARKVARALNKCAKSIETEKFIESTFRTIEISE